MLQRKLLVLDQVGLTKKEELEVFDRENFESSSGSLSNIQGDNPEEESEDVHQGDPNHNDDSEGSDLFSASNPEGNFPPVSRKRKWEM